LVAFALAVVMLSQQLQVSARVSPDRVLLGDTVVLSVTVHSRGDEPVEIIDPPFTGFEVQGSREQSQVTLVGGLAARVTRRAVTLRPVRTGTLTIAPVQVRQGSEAIEAGVLTVVVAAAGAGAERVLGQRVRSLVARSPPPALTPEVVAATVLVSADTVVLGEQVDLVVVAWFPRSVRSRLRNPPTLRPPQLQGAWSYQRPSPAGIALSRQVNGIWYDLFVHHQAVFPLTVGVVNIGSAMVSFTLPLTYSFLSRELRHEVETRPLGVYVYPRPAPRVQGFLGAAGTGLRLEFDVDALEVALGGAISMAVTLAGTGNVALWPEPSIAWPAGLRVYPGDVEVSVAAEGGKLGGTKTFNYLAVADSVGAYGIPATAYAYYDTERRRYVELRTDPVAIVVAGGAPGGALLRGARPPLIHAPGRPIVRRHLTAIPGLAWALGFLLAPLVAGLLRTIPRLRLRLSARRARLRAPRGDPLSRLERQFTGVLGSLVAHAHLRDAEELADALRAAGIEAPVASHAARVRDRLQWALYGPADTTDPDELTAEVQEVLRALLGNAPQGRRSGVVAAVILLTMGIVPALGAQSPERLYEAGAARVAADSFARRTASEPEVARHWHNLGSALYRLGDHAGARAAWVRAARLEPRHPVVSLVHGLVPPSDRRSAELTWVSPITPYEALLAALLLWVVGWVLVTLRRRARTVALVFGLAALAGGYAMWVGDRYAKPVAIVRGDDVPLRTAPYGSAPAARPLSGGSAVLVEREQGAWALVRRGREEGWLLRTEIARL
jgi:hypothetical protein